MPINFEGKPNVSGPPTGDDMDLVATHQRLLVAAAMRTRKPILELGVGWYSTPLLHEIAKAQNRYLLTVDNNEYWLAQFRPLVHANHRMHCVGWWGELAGIDPTTHWGLCFVDQGQPIEREYAVRMLKDRVDVFVMHDTEEGFAYGYDRLLGNIRYPNPPDGQPLPVLSNGMFKYQWTDHCQKVWTTVASNVVDVQQWGLAKLPVVEPSKEIT